MLQRIGAMPATINFIEHNGRGRSRVVHVRKREVDIEWAKIWGLGHWRRLNGEDQADVSVLVSWKRVQRGK